MKYGIVHYNTPELTTCLIASIRKWDSTPEIYIFENSDNRRLDDIWGDLTIFDNTNGQLVDFDKIIAENIKYLSSKSLSAHSSGCKFGSLKHAASIQWLINNLASNFMLMDSDILLKKSPLDVVDNNSIVCDFLMYNNEAIRILPFMCYMNIDVIQKYNLQFLDITRFDSYHLCTDTGGTFCSDILANNIPYKQFNIYDYIVHFGNGSWRYHNTANLPDTEKGNYAGFLLKYKDLWK